MLRHILHIDFDSFFASVEEQYNPHLAGKVFGVTAQNGRTCIIASSKKAKKFGIKTGFRSYEAQKIYPGIILIPADFPKYWEVSKKFLTIASNYSPFVELFSIDEVFIDTTTTNHLFDGPQAVAKRIKTRIQKDIGEHVTVSIGLSYNKLLAKLASGLEKPNGFVEIKPDTVEQIYAKAKLTDVCGIGERIKGRLNNIGIYDLLQLRKASLPVLVGEFGNAEAQFLKQIGNAFDDSPIIPYTQTPSVKSVGREYCLPKNEYDKRIVLQNIFELCEEVALKLRRLNKKGKTVRLSLRGNKNFHMQKTGSFIHAGKDIFAVCFRILQQWEFSYIRMISVGISNLLDEQHVPLSLFDQVQKTEELTSAIDKINQRFGDHTITSGFLLNADKLTTVPNGYMADKYERTKLAQASS